VGEHVLRKPGERLSYISFFPDVFLLSCHYVFCKLYYGAVELKDYNMTANISVEEVLSRLDIVEKVSLLAGNCRLLTFSNTIKSSY
jgi:hypothetical protein